MRNKHPNSPTKKFHRGGKSRKHKQNRGKSNAITCFVCSQIHGHICPRVDRTLKRSKPRKDVPDHRSFQVPTNRIMIPKSVRKQIYEKQR